MIGVPDLEAEIGRRAAVLARSPVFPVVRGPVARTGRRASAAVLVAVGLLVVALLAGVAVGAGWWLRSTLPAPTSTPSQTVGPSTAPSPWTPAAARPGVIAYSVCDRLDADDPSICVGHTRIWVMNADGTGGHELLPDEPGSQSPIAWSPDGQTLLFASDVLGELAMTDAAGSAPERLPREALCPVNLPDCDPLVTTAEFASGGGQLAYVVFASYGGSANCKPGSSCEWRDGRITIRDLATGHVTSLDATQIPGPYKCCDGYYAPSWSADGTRLAFAKPILSSFIVNADGTDLHQLIPAGESGTAPRWSPDGSVIVSAVCGTGPTLFISQPEGTTFATVHDVCDADWTRFGRLVFHYYTADRPGTWISDADGGNLQRLDETISALTAAGCVVCELPVGNQPVWDRSGLWQWLPEDRS